MKINLSTLAKYIPLAVGVAILLIGSLFVPWGNVWPYILGTSPLTALLLLLLGCVYYYGRILRYWLMLKILKQPAKMDKVALAYLIAQPMSIIPGGEFYRSVMLKKYCNVSFRNGVPSVVAQSLTESMGLLVIALAGAALLHRYVAIMVGIGMLFAVAWAIIRWLSTRHSHKLVNKLPTVNISHKKLRTFLLKNRELLGGKNFFALFVSSFISTFSGIAILYLIAKEYGAELDLVQASIAFAVPMMLQFVSFLPAGLGVNEQGSVGVLALFGVGLAAAVAITIIVRAITVLLGMMLGFAAMAIVHFGSYKEYH